MCLTSTVCAAYSRARVVLALLNSVARTGSLRALFFYLLDGTLCTPSPGLGFVLYRSETRANIQGGGRQGEDHRVWRVHVRKHHHHCANYDKYDRLLSFGCTGLRVSES